DMSVYTDEIFGPVLTIVHAESFDDALRLPNENEYGNGVAIFTRDGDAAREFVSRAEVGMVGADVPIPAPTAYHPFGGWKKSRSDTTAHTDEIFGPVLTTVHAESFDDALRLPSENEYGNGVAIFTRDGDAAREFVSRVEVGMVGVNVPIPVPIAYHTFGGWKKSGFGDLNQHGPESIKFYSKVKTVTQRWPSGIKDGAEFVIPTMD